MNKTEFNSTDLQKIANLSMLKLPVAKAELMNLNKQFNSITKLFTKIQQLDLTNVEPLAHPLEITQRLREDIAEEKSAPDKLQKIAPETANDLYLVPKVLD